MKIKKKKERKTHTNINIKQLFVFSMAGVDSTDDI